MHEIERVTPAPATDSRSSGSLFHQTAAYAFSSLSGNWITILSAVLLRKWIPPAQFGLWNMVTVVVDFAGKFDLGVGSAIMRELPLAIGRQDRTELLNLRSSAMALCLLQGFLNTFVVLLYFLMIYSTARGSTWLILGSALLMTFLSPISMGLRSIMMAHGFFKQTGYTDLFTSIITQLLRLAGGFVAGAAGVIASGVSAIFISGGIALYYNRVLGLPQKIAAITRSACGRLMSYGLQLRLHDFPNSIFFTLDSLAVATFYGTEPLAIYATATLAVRLLESPTQLLFIPLRNRWVVEYGKNADIQRIAKDSMNIIIIQVLILWPLLSLFVYTASQLILLTILRNYSGALTILKILLVVWLFQPQSYGIRDPWSIRGDFTLLLVTGVVGVTCFAAAFTVIYTFMKFTSMEAAAYSLLAASIIYMGLLLCLIGREMWGNVNASLVGVSFLSSASCIWLALSVATVPVKFGLDKYTILLRHLSYGLAFVIPIIAVGIYLGLPVIKSLWTAYLKYDNKV